MLGTIYSTEPIGSIRITVRDGGFYPLRFEYRDIIFLGLGLSEHTEKEALTSLCDAVNPRVFRETKDFVIPETIHKTNTVKEEVAVSPDWTLADWARFIKEQASKHGNQATMTGLGNLIVTKTERAK